MPDVVSRHYPVFAEEHLRCLCAGGDCKRRLFDQKSVIIDKMKSRRPLRRAVYYIKHYRFFTTLFCVTEVHFAFFVKTLLMREIAQPIEEVAEVLGIRVVTVDSLNGADTQMAITTDRPKVGLLAGTHHCRGLSGWQTDCDAAGKKWAAVSANAAASSYRA